MSERSGKIARWLRRCSRLSVRALLALILVIAVVLGWVAYRARLQRAAVAAILDAGGQVFYKDQSTSYDPATASLTVSSEPWAPRWLASGPSCI